MDSTGMEHVEFQDAEMECLLNTFGPSDPNVSLEYDRDTRTGSFCIRQSLGRHKLHLWGIQTKLTIRNDFFVDDENSGYYAITHMPPLILHFSLPVGYPDQPPDFFISSLWLPKSMHSRLCCQLNEVVAENSGEAVLWLLVETVQTEGIKLYTESEPDFNGNFKLDLRKFHEKYESELELPFNHYCALLVTHNDDQLDTEFRMDFWECPICAETQSGTNFFRFPRCHHRFCKSCVRDAFQLAIEEGFMSSRLACLQCNEEAGPHEARSVLSNDWYARYESLTLKHGLGLMRDVATCPRPGCETVVLLDDEKLGRCPQCELAFCPVCLRTYHGAARCPRIVPVAEEQEDTRSPEELERLRKEEKATEKFLSEETRPCPGCSAPCEKIGGCNKMVCSYCYIYFCWLCLNPIYDRGNPYEHFKKGPCDGKLFEGCVLPQQ